MQQLACTAKALLLEELVSEGFSVDCSDFHLQKLPEAVEAQSQRVQQLASTAMTFLSAGSSSRQAVAVPDGTGPESTPDRKISRGPEPRSPSQISMMQAEQIRIVPEELRQVPIFTNPAVGYTWGQAVGEAVSRYTVFDHLRHSRITRKLPQASLLEIAASAISEAPFAVASIKVLADPLPGLPLPQLVLLERGRPPEELPGALGPAKLQ